MAKFTSDEQKLLDLYSSVASGNSKYTTKQLNAALKAAKKDSNKYFKDIINVAQTQLTNDIVAQTGDYNYGVQQLNEQIADINQDLATNSQYYTLEEQSALTKQVQDYESQRDSLQNNLSNTGTTISTMGDQQKQQLANTNQNVVESTTREYNKTLADLTTQAARGNRTAQEQLDNLKRTTGESMTKSVIDFESTYGNKNLPKLNGIPTGVSVNPIPKVTGTIKNEMATDVNQRTQAIMDTKRQTSLNF